MKNLDVMSEVFDDKVVKIMHALMLYPEDHFTISDISKETGIGVATTYRKVNTLTRKKILDVKTIGRSKKHKFYTIGSGEKAELMKKVFDVNSQKKQSLPA